MPKVYHVKLSGRPLERDLDRLRRGIFYDNERLAPCEISPIPIRQTIHGMKSRFIRGEINKFARCSSRSAIPSKSCDVSKSDFSRTPSSLLASGGT